MSTLGESSVEPMLSRDGWRETTVCVDLRLFKERAKAIVRQPPPSTGMLLLVLEPYAEAVRGQK